MSTAPLRTDLTTLPAEARALWVHAADGIRLRVTICPTGSRGTVLLFTGRTEYAEKYGRVASRLAAAGFACALIDWRGQGLSDRVAADPMLGHVAAFRDYQADVAAFMQAVRLEGLPTPYFLLAHSMGGAIGLRAVLRGLDVRTAVFSSPMWGISFPAGTERMAQLFVGACGVLGLGLTYAPGTTNRSFVLEQPFDGNTLTHDPGCYRMMQRQVSEVSRFGLGGPSMNWLREAFREMTSLASAPPRGLRVLTIVGDDERVVLPKAMHARTCSWPGARIEVLDDCRHEPMMETADVLGRFMDLALGEYETRAAPG